MTRHILLFLIFFSSLTFAQTTYYSRSSGNWNDPNTWSTNGCGVAGNTGTFPQLGDIAYVCHNVLINNNPSCQDIIVNNLGILEFDNVGVHSVTLSGSLTVNTGGTFRYQSNATLAHQINIGSGLFNNGSIDFYYDNNDYVAITFDGPNLGVVSGTGLWDLYNITINKSTKNTLLEVTTTGFYSNFNAGSWTHTQGTYLHNNSATFTLGNASNYTINQNSIVRIDGNGTINFSTSASMLTLQGRLELMSGTINIGSTNGAAPNGIRYEQVAGITPELIIHSGNVNLFQGITYKSSAAHPLAFSMYGGTLNLNTGSTVSNTETFRVNDVSSSVFYTSGGTIQYYKPNSAALSDLNVCGAAGNVTTPGGTVIFGNGATPNNTTFLFTPYFNAVLPNIRVSGVAGNITTVKPTSAGNFRVNSLYIEENKNFDISHNSNMSDGRTVTIAGTYDGTHCFWDANSSVADHFLYRNSIVVIEGSSTIKVNSADTYLPRFYNLQCASPGQTTTLEETMGVSNIVYLLGGTLTSQSWQQLYVHGGDPFDFTAGSVISVESVKFFRSNSSQNVIGYDYDTKLVMAGNNSNYTMQGNTSCISLYVNGDYTTTRSATFYLGNVTLEIANDLEIGTSGGTSTLKKFYANTGNIVVNGNVRIFEDAELYGESSAIYVYGNWENTALNVASRGFNENNSTVIFSGANASLSCTNGPEGFYNIRIDKNAGDLTLTAPITVSHDCQFSAGKIISSAANHVTFLYGTTHAGGSNTSFIEGPLRYVGFGTLVFPVGKGTQYRPVTMYATVSGNSSDIHRAEYFATSPDPFYPVAQRDGVLNSVSTCEYWQMTRENGSSSGHIRLPYNSAGSCNTASFGAFAVAKWNGSSWNKLGGTGGAGRSGNATAGSEESCVNTSFDNAFTHAVETAPIITASGPTTFCTGSSITLTASSGGSYVWSTTETTQVITVNSSGSYTVTVGPCGATSAPTVITTTSAPAEPTASNVNICSGGTANLTASGSPSSYNWYSASSGGSPLATGANYTTPVLTVTTTYYVASLNGSCESATRTPVTVYVSAKPTLHTNVTNVYSCGDAKLIAYTDGLGNSISLDGTDDYMAVPAGNYFTGDYTIEAWVKPRSVNNWARIIDFGNGAPNNNIILATTFGTTGRPSLMTYKGTSQRSITVPLSEMPVLNEWVHIAATVKDSTGSIYINGKLVVTGLVYPAQNVVTNSNYVGRSNFAGHGYANMDIDELRIWNVARTQAQISAGVEISYPTGTPNIISYLRMNEGTGVITDDDVNPLNTQLWGGATWNTFNGPTDVTYSWAPTTGLTPATGRQVAAGPPAATTYTVTATYSTGCTNTAAITVNTVIPGGDTSVYGDNYWNVFAYRSLNFTNYAGYYTNSTLSFNSASHFNDLLSPSSAVNWQGCEVPVDNFSIIAKRTNFPDNIYQITIIENDDSCSMYVNNKLRLSRSISSVNTPVWTGRLNASSKIEFRLSDSQVFARGNFTIISVVQPTLTAGSISADQSFCMSGNPLLLNSVSPASGCTLTGYQWQDSIAGGVWTDISGATGITYDPPAITQTTWYRRKATDDCGAFAYTNAVRVLIIVPTGDTAVFGNAEWNVYGFNSTNFTNYFGYYTDPVLNMVSGNVWGHTQSPSNATGYTGCTIPSTNFSLRAKRTNFTPGSYTLYISNDDSMYLYIDGVLKSAQNTSGGAIRWTGYLENSSTIELRLIEFAGNSYMDLVFTPIATPTLDPGSIGSDQSFCYSGNPLAFSSLAPATGCTFTYQWQDSIAGGVWTDIAGAVAATYDAGVLTQTTWYRRKVQDDCNSIAYTNELTVYVGNPSAPVVDGASVFCGPSVTTLTAVTAEPTVKWYNAPTGGTLLYTGNSYTTGTISSNTNIYAAAVTTTGCESATRTLKTITIYPQPDVTVSNVCGGEFFVANVSSATSSLKFDGVNDHASVASVSSIGAGFTVEAWVYLNSYGSGATLIDFGNGTNSDNITIKLSEGSSGKPSAYIYQGGSSRSLLTQTTPIPLNQWTHVAYTHSVGTGYFYINGEMAGGTGVSWAPANITRTVNSIGRSNDGSNHINGNIDQLRIWTTARTQAQVKASMLSEMPPVSSDLLYNFTLNEGSGGASTDITSSAVATLQNGTLWNAAGAPLGFTYQWTPSATLLSDNEWKVRGLSTITQTYEVVVTSVNGCKDSAEASNTIAPGDTSLFGNNQWNVYAFDGVAFNSYYGSFVIAPLSFDTKTIFPENASPSFAAGYTGCAVGDEFSFRAKRTNFQNGQYTINITGHDDGITVLVDGVSVFNDFGCCDSHPNVWTGYLNNTSTVEFRHRDFLRNGFLSVVNDFNPRPIDAGIIGSDQTICLGATPAAVTDISAASGCGTLTYLWEDSTDGVAWQSIGVSTASLNPPAITENTWYRRIVGDQCNASDTSNVVRIAVDDAGTPVVSDVSTCAGYTATFTGAGSVDSYKWYDAASGGSLLYTGNPYAVLASVPDTVYVAATYNGCESARVLVKLNVSGTAPDVSFSKPEFCATDLIFPTVNGLSNAVAFDGADDYAQVPPGVYFNGDFTVESWVKLDRFTHWQRLFDFGNGTDSDNVFVTFDASDDQYIEFHIYNGGNRTILRSKPGKNPYLDNWFHIACVVQGTTGYIYINGELSALGTMLAPLNVVRNNNYIARSNWADPTTKGTFDEMRIWSTARTQVEIQSSMYTSVAVNATGLQNYWQCNESSGTTLTDVTSGANATMMNGATHVSGGAPIGLAFSWTPVMNLTSSNTLFTHANPPAQTTYKVVVDNGGCKDSATVLINPMPTGDTSLYGTNEWIGYTYEGFNYDAYHGFYTEPTVLTFNSESVYAANSQPSIALSYLGCAVSQDYHSSLIRRTNFPDGFFRLKINNHDDYLLVRKDYDTIFYHHWWGDAHDTAWIGKLTDTTLMDFQLQNSLDNTLLSFEFVPIVPPGLTGGTVSAPQTLCGFQVPDTLRSVTPAVGCSQLKYQWQDSTAASGEWNDILTATRSYLIPAAVSETTWFRRKATDACIQTAYSNVIEVTVDSPDPPLAPGKSICSPGAVTLTASGPTNSFRWYDAPGGGTLLSSTPSYTPVVLSTSYYYVSAVSILGCEGARTTVEAKVISTPPGDTALFGTDAWLVYAFQGANFDAYRGYYSDPSLHINTTTQWDQMLSPSEASGYQGCVIPADNFSVRFKREGFPAGNYRIDITDHKDSFALYVDGAKVYEYAGSDGAHYRAWQGTLDNFSTVELRLQESTQAAFLKVNFILISGAVDGPVAGIINNNQQFCNSGVPSQITDGRTVPVLIDAHVDEQNASTNYGTSTLMGVKTSPSSQYTYTYLMFDLGATPEPVVTAKVHLYGNTNGSDGNNLAGIYSVSDVLWSETGIMFSNRPSEGIMLDTIRFNRNNGWYTLDVSDYVAARITAGDRYITFMLKMEDVATNIVNISSRESMYAPELRLNKSYSPCNFQYQWQQSAGCSNSWTSIPGADTAVYTPGLLTETTCFRKIVFDNCGRIDSSNIVTVVIDSLSLAGTLAGTTPVCENVNTGIIAVTGSRGSFVNWESSSDNVNFVSLSLANDSLTFSNIADTTWYRAIVKNESCPEDTSLSYQISTIATTVAGTVLQDTSVCFGNNATLQLTGNTGMVIRWEKSTDDFVTPVTIANATQVHSEPVSVATKFRAVVQNGTCSSAISAAAEVTIIQPPVGVISQEQRVIKGMNNGWVHISAFVDPIVRWEVSNDGVQFNSVALTADSLQFTNITDSSWYRVIMLSPSCGETISDVVPVRVYNAMQFNLPDTIDVFRDQTFISPVSLLSRILYKDVYTVNIQNGTSSSSKGGSFQVNPDGTFIYQPPVGYLGIDSVDFDICTPDLTMVYCENQPVYFRMIEQPAGPGPIVLYSSFSPNGDGANDEWVIENIQFFPDNAVRILDRWGKLVFEQEGYNNSSKVWKGEANQGKRDLPEDTYYYILEIDKKIAKTGFVVIKR